MRPAAAQQGFTLIEVLVALTLMALVSLISWRGLDAVQQTGERLDARSEEALALVRALGQIERDLLLHAGQDILPDPVAAAVDNAPGSDRAVRMPAGIVWDPEAGLTLVRSAGDGLWQQLRWHLHEGNLMRAAGAPSYLLPLPVPHTSVVVLEGVEALSVRLWLPGQGWTDPPSRAGNGTTPPTQRANPPRTDPAAQLASTTGLEVALIRQGANADQPYRKVVLLP